MACDPLSYSGVDASMWASITERIESEYGIRIDSERGEASKRGFKLKWAYEPGEATLEIQCLDKPFITPCAVVNSYINGVAKKSGLAAGCGPKRLQPDATGAPWSASVNASDVITSENIG